jgi:hypothetical protein
LGVSFAPKLWRAVQLRHLRRQRRAAGLPEMSNVVVQETRGLLKYDEVDGEMNGPKKVIYYCSVLLTRYEDKCAPTAFCVC